jgi:hypothetical protein
MPYRNKVFVCFDGDNDINYYYLMKAWKQNDNTDFNFYDAHDLTQARDTSLEATIKRSLRDRLNNSKVFVVLIGERTRYLVKFVRWEMEQALQMDLPVIGVNLNGLRYLDEILCPPILRDELVMHISFNAKILQFALENWPSQHSQLRSEGTVGPYYYKSELYKNVGL